ncbi:N-formylglutamate amidohydrolase [Desulfocicer vacuolatum DSM 3385]|uniref:N-formylglutamate amidohydrolase n=1 Tax=Desulfocicer vacuolatum DSM 3385 TaxID=1121400 RepID=A0A1W2CFN5_9BACT|nr:N-formylglutamate amidohydrolase [Desulfocicer vacuolatum]SMC83971.1 N-formylglutamate amidohydrolase [Desulfocicer vacuolatum DSM 3385]
MPLPFIDSIKKQISQQDHIYGTDSSRGFAYDFDFSTPVIATAIHAGHHVRDELIPFMEIPREQRLFEEDTATEKMIQRLPNTIWALESRAVYDLNRSPDMALPLTPEKFWGIKVYKKHPPPEMNKKSLESHARFYDFMGTVISHMLDKFNICIVLDIHSYNISRQIEKGFASPPVFNLGTESIDRSKWKEQIQAWLMALETISLPREITTTVSENEVFSGKGYLCQCLSTWDDRILVLPTEVAKVYMDEHTGKVYDDVIGALANEFHRIIH